MPLIIIADKNDVASVGVVYCSIGCGYLHHIAVIIIAPTADFDFHIAVGKVNNGTGELVVEVGNLLVEANRTITGKESASTSENKDNEDKSGNFAFHLGISFSFSVPVL